MGGKDLIIRLGYLVHIRVKCKQAMRNLPARFRQSDPELNEYSAARFSEIRFEYNYYRNELKMDKTHVIPNDHHKRSDCVVDLVNEIIHKCRINDMADRRKPNIKCLFPFKFCFVNVFLIDSCNVFTQIIQDCLTPTGSTIVILPRCSWCRWLSAKLHYLHC